MSKSSSGLTQFWAGGPLACGVVYLVSMVVVVVGVKMTMFGGWLILTAPELGHRLFGGPVVALAGAGIVLLCVHGAWMMVEGIILPGRLRLAVRAALVLGVVGAFAVTTNQYL